MEWMSNKPTFCFGKLSCTVTEPNGRECDHSHVICVYLLVDRIGQRRSRVTFSGWVGVTNTMPSGKLVGVCSSNYLHDCYTLGPWFCVSVSCALCRCVVSFSDERTLCGNCYRIARNAQSKTRDIYIHRCCVCVHSRGAFAANGQMTRTHAEEFRKHTDRQTESDGATGLASSASRTRTPIALFTRRFMLAKCVCVCLRYASASASAQREMALSGFSWWCVSTIRWHAVCCFHVDVHGRNRTELMWRIYAWRNYRTIDERMMDTNQGGIMTCNRCISRWTIMYSTFRERKILIRTLEGC